MRGSVIYITIFENGRLVTKACGVMDSISTFYTSKGQDIMPDIKTMLVGDGRDTFYGFTNTDKVIEIPVSKLSVKGKTAGGATTTARILKKVI